MKRLTLVLATIFAAASLTGCGGGSSGGGNNNSNTGNSGGGSGGGEMVAASAMDVAIVSQAPLESDGTSEVTVTFTVFLPERAEGATVPLIVHSHGFGGSRVGIDEANADPAADDDIDSNRDVFARLDDQVRLLWDAGYAVVSFDERGFGRGDDGDDGNSGLIQIMDPDFEIIDAISVMDWIDDPANGIADIIARDENNNMIAGAIGGSYGGGYQLLLAALDDRLDAITPTATWYNLLQSLLPNEVIKKGFSSGLCLLIDTDGAESGTRTASACAQASDSGSMGGAAARYRDDIASERDALEEAFQNHGMIEIERRHNEEAGFTMRPVDTLLVQGGRDVLFSLNQSYENYRFLNSIEGADVRLLSMENGHGLPTRMNPGSQGALGPTACGPFSGTLAIRAWFDLKLRGNTALRNVVPPEICLSLDNTTGVLLDEFPVATGSDSRFDNWAVTIPETDVTAQDNNIMSQGGGAFFALDAIDQDGLVLAGIPTGTFSLAPTNLAAEQNGGSTVFIGVGIRRGGEVFLVDDQVQPLRTTPQEMDTSGELFLVGISENLQQGDEVGVLIYGNFDVYETGAGAVPANYGLNNNVTISGTVRLPIIAASTVSR